MEFRPDPNHELAAVGFSGGRGGKKRFVRQQFRDVFINELADLPVDFGLVRAVASPKEEPGAAANEAFVGIRPLDDLEIPGRSFLDSGWRNSGIHDFDSCTAAMASFTSFSW